MPGHWESDLIMGTNNRSAVATMVERTSRFVILAKLDAPTADAALEAMTRELSRMAPALLKTMTHDQGSEMARHAELTARTGMKIYFAGQVHERVLKIDARTYRKADGYFHR